MAFHVVNRQRGYAQGHCNAAAGGGTDQQGANQSRPGSIGNRIDIATRETGICKALIDQR